MRKSCIRGSKKRRLRLIAAWARSVNTEFICDQQEGETTLEDLRRLRVSIQFAHDPRMPVVAEHRQLLCEVDDLPSSHVISPG